MEPISDIRKVILSIPTEELSFTAEIMQWFTEENIAVAFHDLTNRHFGHRRHQTTRYNEKQLNSFFHTHSECKSSAIFIPFLFECSDQQKNGYFVIWIIIRLFKVTILIEHSGGNLLLPKLLMQAVFGFGLLSIR